MKIDKTEKEWRTQVAGHLPARWTEAERRQVAATIAQAVGLEFKEEEPELPERIEPHEVHKHRREAAARWNAVSRLCNSDHPIYPKTIEDIVRQEREKLQ